MSLIKLPNSLWAVLGSVSERVFTLATYILVARSVDLTDFGDVLIAIIIVEFLSYILTMGIKEFILTNQIHDVKERSSVFFYLFKYVVSITFFLGVSIWFFSFYYECKFLNYVFYMLPIPIMSYFSAYYLSVLELDFEYKKIATRSTFIASLSGAVATMIASFDGGIWSIFSQKYLYAILDLIVLFSMCKNSLSYTKNQPLNIYNISTFTKHYTISQVFNYISGKIYEIAVYLIYGSPALALVDVARKIILTLNKVVLSPLNSYSLSRSSRVVSKKEFYFNITFSLGLLYVPIIGGLAGASELLINTIFTDKFSESSYLMKVFGFLFLPTLAIAFFQSQAISSGKTNIVSVMFVLNIFLVSTVSFLSSEIDVGLIKLLEVLSLVSLFYVMMISVFFKYKLGISLCRYFLIIPIFYFVFFCFNLMSEVIVGFSAVKGLGGYYSIVALVSILMPIYGLYIALMIFLFKPLRNIFFEEIRKK